MSEKILEWDEKQQSNKATKWDDLSGEGTRSCGWIKVPVVLKNKSLLKFSAHYLHVNALFSTGTLNDKAFVEHFRLNVTSCIFQY